MTRADAAARDPSIQPVTAGRPDVSTRAGRLKMHYPTVEDLRAAARRRIPRFAFDYVDGAAGADDRNKRRNAAALDAVEIVPRYGVENFTPDTEIELFGRRYAGPIGVAPMGIPCLVMPGGEAAFARAARAQRVPFTLGSSAGLAIERVAELAGEYAWFQLYRHPNDGLAITMDMAKRAHAAGVPVLVLTVDVPARTKRPRELRNRLLIPYRVGLRTVWDVATHPAWLAAYLRHGQTAFANYRVYAGEGVSNDELTDFMRRESGGAFSWDEIARLRDEWPGALVVKGVMHPGDAERAHTLGVDGVVVSNHGGRQLEAAPAAIDVLPAVAAAVGGHMSVMFDGGIRSGVDIVRALALGARFALAGRAFMYGLGALSEEGPGFVADFLLEELREALRQVGARDCGEARALVTRHPGAFAFDRAKPRAPRETDLT